MQESIIKYHATGFLRKKNRFHISPSGREHEAAGTCRGRRSDAVRVRRWRREPRASQDRGATRRVGRETAPVERISIRGASLDGNLEGNAVDRDALVVLPPTYSTDKRRRYPVVYALHGYSIGAEQWSKEIHVPQTIEGAFAAGAREMIVVLPDSKTVHNGSMYSSSITTGDFERFVARDVVSYIDAHYRTIPNRASRGLVGHSMGGYGASRIGMKHGDVFGSLYIMSPCCLSPRGAPPANPANDEVNGQEVIGIYNDRHAADAAFDPTVIPRDGETLIVGDATLAWHAVDTLAVAVVNAPREMPGVRLAIGDRRRGVEAPDAEEGTERDPCGDRQRRRRDGLLRAVARWRRSPDQGAQHQPDKSLTSHASSH